MNALIQYGAETKTVSTVHGKTGATTTRLLKAAEFKESYKAAHPDASNRDVKKAFEEYYKSSAKASTAELAAKMTCGTLGVESFSVNKDGDKLKVTFVDLSEESAEKEIQGKLENLSAEQLTNLFELIAAKLEKTEKPN